MDDTTHYLTAAQAKQARQHGEHWALFWRWCITSARRPLPATEDDLRVWLSGSPEHANLASAHAAVLEINAVHEANDLPNPFTSHLGTAA